jgi:hypothetical protein
MEVTQGGVLLASFVAALTAFLQHWIRGRNKAEPSVEPQALTRDEVMDLILQILRGGKDVLPKVKSKEEEIRELIQGRTQVDENVN